MSKSTSTVLWALSTAATASLCMSLSADVGVISQAADGKANLQSPRFMALNQHISPAAIPVPQMRNQRPEYQQIGSCSEFEFGFEPPAYTLGPISGQNGWTVFAAAGPDFPVVSNQNPASGTQHLRNIRNTGVVEGTNNGAFSPACEPGATSMSVDVYISNAGGSDYRIQPQAPSQGFQTAQVWFLFTGEIILIDEIGGSFVFVDTGATWVCGEYKQFALVIDNDKDTIDYYYDGELIYTGARWAGTMIEHVILGSNNFHLDGEFGDFDNLAAPADIEIPEPSCVGDLNNDGVVNVSDLLILLGDWGSCPGCDSDLNKDGVVNVSDMLVLLGAWGACPELGDPVFTGGCCNGPDCTIQTEEACIASGGQYAGDCTTCDQAVCEDGTTCAAALTINIGDTVQGSSVGNPVGSAQGCGGAGAPNAPTIWYKVIGDGTTLTASTCGSGMQDTNVTVYCGASCSALECAGGAGDGCDGGNPFQATASWCAGAGQTYYIAVWGTGGAGDLSLTVTSNNNSCTPTCGSLGACCVDGNCEDNVFQDNCEGIWAEDVTCANFTCPTYAYDTGVTTNALNWIDGGVAMWMQSFDVAGGGNDVINEVGTTFNLSTGTPGVVEGQIFGVAIFADDNGLPGALLWQGTDTATAAAVQTDAVQYVSTGGVNVSGSFFIAAWAQTAAGTFGAPMDENVVIPDRVFFTGTVGGTFGTFDPANPEADLFEMVEINFPTVWVLRAN